MTPLPPLTPEGKVLSDLSALLSNVSIIAAGVMGERPSDALACLMADAFKGLEAIDQTAARDLCRAMADGLPASASQGHVRARTAELIEILGRLYDAEDAAEGVTP